MKHVFAVVLLLCSTALAAREPKYAPKTARTLHSDAEIARARENIKKYPAAAALAETTIKAADKWLDWKDEDLRFLLTSSDVPRAFAVSASGCPVCGDKIKTKGGDYGWIIDPKIPFKIKCPIDGTVFPTNDYEAYYRSGFKDKKGFDTQYADDGWGWKDPKTGEKFWFVAYYNHWMWHKHLVLGVGYLGNAYLLTGDKRYAQKAAVMLRRIAEVYPGMDHAKQSRYGQMMAARGIDYPGKVSNHIWETGLAQTVADAYDAVLDQVDPADRTFIEANFLEDAIDAYFQKKIRGNFGMHQSALVHLAQVRQTGESDKWFDGLLNESSKDYPTLGLNFALYNLIDRNGFPCETSPGYNYLWVNKITAYGDLLQRAGRDVFGIPRTRRLFDAVIDQVNAGQFTPDLGDTGSMWGDLIGDDPATFLTAYHYYKTPRYLAFIAAKGDPNFKSFESLFHDPVVIPPDPTLYPAKPRLFDGYGLAVLNDSPDKTSLALTYGLKHGHGHFDRLSFELFANGQPIMPDLGYPDAMNDFVPGIYTWSKNTISHNTVVVDGKRQLGNVPGEVKFFANSPFARVVDIEAKGTYPQCSSYRRAIIMIDAGDYQTYFVDIFTVAGGNQHDYSLHGPPGDFEMIGGAWSNPAKGTLAGENVPLGEIYDDPKLGAKDYKGGFSGYTGSGFQHLFNVRTLKPTSTVGQSGAPPRATTTPSTPDPWIAQWKHEKDPHSMLRIRILPQPDQQLLLADAHVSPAKFPQIIKYLIARRTGRDLISTYISVIEPFKDKPFIEDVKLSFDGKLTIRHTNGMRDEITYQKHSLSVGNVHPAMAVDRFEKDGDRTHGFRVWTTPATKPSENIGDRALTGKVVEVLPMQSAVTVELSPFPRDVTPESLIGQVIHFKNANHRTACTIAAVRKEQDQYVLTLADDLLVGLAKIDSVEPGIIHTSTAMPLAPTYAGTTLSDDLFRVSVSVKSVSSGEIHLEKPLAPDHNLKPGDNLWLLNAGVGDTIEIPLVRSD